jgi:hypothetical protein
LRRESKPANRPGWAVAGRLFSSSQFGKYGAATVAVPFVIAPVFVSKLSAKDTTPERTEDMPVEDTLMVVPRENGKVISTVSVLKSRLYTLVPFPPAVYFASLDDPVPDTPDRSMVRMTAGGRWNLLVSSTSSLETCA